MLLLAPISDSPPGPWRPALALIVLAGAAFLAPACGSTRPGAPRPPALIPPPVIAGQGTLARVAAPRAVPLRGERVDAEVGDFVLSNAGVVAVVSGRNGDVVDFAPEGDEDALVAISTAAFDGLSMVRAPVVRAAFVGPASNVLELERRAAHPAVRLVTHYALRDKTLAISSQLVDDPLRDEPPSPSVVGLGERVDWGNLPTYVEGVGFVSSFGGEFSASYLGREGRLSYALALADGPISTHVSPAGLAGFYAHPRASELTVTGDRRARTLLMSLSTVSLADAVAALDPLAGQAQVALPGGLPADAHIDVARCLVDGFRRPYTRASPRDARVVVPAGCFDARVVAPGHTPSEWVSLDLLPGITLAPPGTLVVTIVEAGKPAPARVQVRGVTGTPTPDFGEDPDEGAAVNAIHTHTGRVERTVPGGSYRVIVDRGFEHTAFETTVDIRPGETTQVEAELTRVVDTRGWIAADLHLHASPSPDAPQSLAERVRSLAASGVEVGVATDHNRVTDYTSAIRELSLGAHVASVIGDEVTTEEAIFGHFNVFPLAAGSDPLAYRKTHPDAVLAEARGRAPLFEDVVVQVNHPRMGDIGYFDLIRLDAADVPRMQRRHPSWLGFDAIEVYNGDDAVAIPNVELVMQDWLALVDAGLPVTATGNSDSHRTSFHEPGLPRTYVAMQDDDPAHFDQRAFAAAIRAGRVIVSGGPFIRFSVDGAPIGGTVAPGVRRAHVTVDAPPWMDVSCIEIWVDGRVAAQTNGPFPKGAHAAEFAADLRVLDGDAILAVARGRQEMDVLFRRGVVPFAFTNVIHVAR